MSWLLSLILTSGILHLSSASFLSTIDEYRRVDSGSGGARPLKRHGSISATPMPMPEGGDGEGERPSLGADEEGLDCDAIMRQCECGGPRVADRPTPQQQQQTFGFDEPEFDSLDYAPRGTPKPRRRQ